MITIISLTLCHIHHDFLCFWCIQRFVLAPPFPPLLIACTLAAAYINSYSALSVCISLVSWLPTAALPVAWLLQVSLLVVSHHVPDLFLLPHRLWFALLPVPFFASLDCSPDHWALDNWQTHQYSLTVKPDHRIGECKPAHPATEANAPHDISVQSFSI